MATIKIYPRLDRKDSKGLCPIRIEIQNQGKRMYRSVSSVRINPDNWDYANSRVTTAEHNHQGINRLIEKKRNDTSNAVLEMEYVADGFNRVTLAQKLDGVASNDFYAFYEQTMKTKGGTISSATKTIYEDSLKKVKRFKKTLTFSELTPDFLEGYEAHLRDLGNMVNTIHKSMKCLRFMVNRANDTIGAKNNAFKIYKMKKESNNIESLEMHQLEVLLTALYTGRAQKISKYGTDVLALFCFQCMTGLRFGDAVEFNYFRDVTGDVIRLNATKTSKPVYMPIHGKLRVLFAKYGTKFRQISNQSANRIIKSIGMALGIEVPLTTHVAVHSFSTICLDLGIDIKTISKLRGHTSVKTTEIYAKVRDKKIDAEVREAWGA